MAFLREIRAKRQAKVDPDTQIKYTYCGHEITLQTDPEGGVAGLVWFAYPRVMNWIETRYNSDCNIFANTKTLELGAGTGLAGILLATLGSKVVLTDRFEVLPLLNINIQLNKVETNAQAKELNWGEDVSGFNPPFDLLVVCDCIYNLQFGPVLLKSMIELSGPNTQIIFGYSTRNKPEEIKFFETVAESFAIEKLEGGDPEDKEPNLLLLRKK